MSSFNVYSTKLLTLVTAFAACTLPMSYSWQKANAHPTSPSVDRTNKQVEVFSKAQGVNAFKQPTRLSNQIADYQVASYDPTSTPLVGTSVSPPRLAVFNNQLVAFITGGGYSRVLYRRMYSNWSWDDHWSQVPGKITFNSVPSVVVFNDRLVALVSGRGGKIYITQTDKNWNWNSEWNEVPGNGRTFAAPVATVFNGKLVVLIRGGEGVEDDTRMYITQTDKNWNWNSEWSEVPGNGRTSAAPAAAVFNDKLVILARGQRVRGGEDDTRIYITQTDKNWNWNSKWNEVPGDGRTEDTPSLTVFNNRLVTLIRGQKDDTRIYITQTDKNWNWNSRWNEVPGDGQTAFSPAVAVFNGMLAVLIRGVGTDGQVYVTNTDANWKWHSRWNEFLRIISGFVTIIQASADFFRGLGNNTTLQSTRTKLTV